MHPTLRLAYHPMKKDYIMLLFLFPFYFFLPQVTFLFDLPKSAKMPHLDSCCVMFDLSKLNS